MALRATRILSCLALLGGLLPLGCVHHHHHPPAAPPPPVVVHEHRGGPPPHAPAHGYRRKHKARHGHVELVYDSGLGVYVVVGWPVHYFHDGRFYRVREHRWEACDDLKGAWVVVSADVLPRGLVAHHADKPGKKHKHHRGPHPAKHGY
jgi:hypothetical protein